MGGERMMGGGREGERSPWGNVLAMQIQAQQSTASSLYIFNSVSTVHLDISVWQLTNSKMFSFIKTMQQELCIWSDGVCKSHIQISIWIFVSEA